MAIRFQYQKDEFKLTDEAKIKQWITNVVTNKSFKVIDSVQCSVGNINYFFCDDEYLIEANRRFLNHDTYTDIITFDYVSGGLISGDIMISVDRVGENAEKFGVDSEQELRRVIIHGVLHLLGQADKSEEAAAEMRRKENAALKLWNTI